MKLTKLKLEQLIKEELTSLTEDDYDYDNPPPAEMIADALQDGLKRLVPAYDMDQSVEEAVHNRVMEFARELYELMGNPEIGVDPERYHDDPRNHPEEPRPIKEKNDKWIQGAEKDIEKRGTEGVCTGDKFGGPTCKPGTKRYNLAKTFRKMGKKNKKKKD